MFVCTDRGHLRHALETGPGGEERGSDGVKREGVRRAVMGGKREGVRRAVMGEKREGVRRAVMGGKRQGGGALQSMTCSVAAFRASSDGQFHTTVRRGEGGVGSEGGRRRSEGGGGVREGEEV